MQQQEAGPTRNANHKKIRRAQLTHSNTTSNPRGSAPQAHNDKGLRGLPLYLPVVFFVRKGGGPVVSRKSVLRAVAPDETPEPPMILTLDEAIELGDYLEILRAQRRSIAAAIPEEKGPALAALHGKLSAISKEIEALRSRESDEAEGGADVEDGEFDAEAI